MKLFYTERDQTPLKCKILCTLLVDLTYNTTDIADEMLIGRFLETQCVSPPVVLETLHYGIDNVWIKSAWTSSMEPEES